MTQEFDFVVVGGGTTGCLLASRLAHTPSHPPVALLEAGPTIDKPEWRHTAERFTTVYMYPNLDYGYKSTPQAAANDRRVNQERGKGLGGSSAVNFQVWSLGARPEFDAWADKAGDQSWGFENVLKKVKEIENLYVDQVDAKWTGYINPDPKDHGYSGPVDVSIGPVEEEIKRFFDAGVDLGHNLNPDPNDGDLIGLSLAPSTSLNGVRTTSASAFLEKTPVPHNMTVVTDARIVKVLVEGDRAVGVVREDGSRVLARKEVILSAGAFDSPRLLLLSGIGPREDLESIGIRVVKDLPGVGSSLSDHSTAAVSFQMKPGYTNRREKWAKYEAAQFKDESGALADLYSSAPHAFLESEDSYRSPEFAALPEETRQYLTTPGVPSYEIIAGPSLVPDSRYESPSHGFLSLIVANMNSVSRGTVKLASSNPQDAPLINPAYISDPYDALNLSLGVREAMKFVKTPAVKDFCVGPLVVPKSDSDEDVLDFVRSGVTGLWHPSCSLKMGRGESDGSVVDSDLKVHGLKGLRVADLSVTPLLPSGHPQIIAYVIGQVAVDKIAKEYAL